MAINNKYKGNKNNGDSTNNNSRSFNIPANTTSTYNAYKAPGFQFDNIKTDKIDVSSLNFNQKLYPYDGYGISANGIDSISSKFTSWGDFQQKMWEMKVFQKQLESTTGTGVLNEYIYNIGLDYTDDSRIDQTKHYIEACFDRQALNYFYQQNSNWAQWGQDKNNLSLFVKLDLTSDNKIWFFSYNEDLMQLTPIQPGEPLPSTSVIYSMEYFSPIQYNGDGTFVYGLIGLKKVQPYFVSSEGVQINTQFNINKPLGSSISRIRLKISGPFLLNTIFMWDANNTVRQLDYSVINGKDLREINITPFITANSIKWMSKDTNDLQNAWNIWQYTRSVDRFEVYNIKTSDGVINTRGGNLPINVVSNVLYGGMKHSDGLPGGIWTLIPPNPLSYSTVKDYYPTESDYSGNGEYKLIYYSNRLGSLIDDGLYFDNPYDLANTLSVSRSIIFGLKDNHGNPAFKSESRIYDRLFDRDGENEGRGDRPSMKRWSNRLQWTVDWLQYFSNTYGNDTTDYGSSTGNLPRAFRNKISSWNANKPSLYRLDSSCFLRPNNAGFTKEYFAIVSKPVRSDRLFGINQGLGSNYYYDSTKNHEIKCRVLTKTHLIAGGIRPYDGKGVFPTWLQQRNKDFNIKDSLSTVLGDSYECLSPFTLEQWLPQFKVQNNPNSNIAMLSYQYEINTIRSGSQSLFNTPTLEYPNTNATRYLENNIFTRKFNQDEKVLLDLHNNLADLDGKYVIDFYPVENNTTNRKQAISNLTGYLASIYGGFELEWEFYNGGTLIASIKEDAYNKGNSLRATKVRVLGTQVVDGESAEKRPIINQWVQTSLLANNAVTNLILDNPNNFTTNIKSVKAFDITTREEFIGQVSVVTPNIEYNFVWNNLAEGKSYDVVMEWSYYELGVGEVTLPNESLLINTTVLGPDLINTTLIELSQNSLKTMLYIEKNGAEITSTQAIAVSNLDVIPASIFRDNNNGTFSLEWNENLKPSTTYTINMQINWNKNQYSDSIIRNDVTFTTLGQTVPGSNFVYFIDANDTIGSDLRTYVTSNSEVNLKYPYPSNNESSNSFYNISNRFDIDPTSKTALVNFRVTQNLYNQWENLKQLNQSDPSRNKWVFNIYSATVALAYWKYPGNDVPPGSLLGTLTYNLNISNDDWVTKRSIAQVTRNHYKPTGGSVTALSSILDINLTDDAILNVGTQFRFGYQLSNRNALAEFYVTTQFQTQNAFNTNVIYLQFVNQITGQVISPLEAKELEIKDLEIEKLKLEIENLKK